MEITPGQLIPLTPIVISAYYRDYAEYASVTCLVCGMTCSAIWLLRKHQRQTQHHPPQKRTPRASELLGEYGYSADRITSFDDINELISRNNDISALDTDEDPDVDFTDDNLDVDFTDQETRPVTRTVMDGYSWSSAEWSKWLRGAGFAVISSLAKFAIQTKTGVAAGSSVGKMSKSLEKRDNLSLKGFNNAEISAGAVKPKKRHQVQAREWKIAMD